MAMTIARKIMCIGLVLTLYFISVLATSTQDQAEMPLRLKKKYLNFLLNVNENLRREALENAKIMQDDLLTMCYFENSCTGPGIQTPPGTNCCSISESFFQKRRIGGKIHCCSCWPDIECVYL